MEKVVPAPHRIALLQGVLAEALARPAVVGDSEVGRRALGPAGRAVAGVAVDGIAGAATNADQRTGSRHFSHVTTRLEADVHAPDHAPRLSRSRYRRAPSRA